MNENDILDHFIKAQNKMYSTALTEIELGKKRSHWMWYIFPQHINLGLSFNAKRYGIHSLNHARSYLNHEILGERLRTMVRATLLHHNQSATQLFDSEIDALKFQSSLTLFMLASESPSDEKLFSWALQVFYQGKQCELTQHHLTHSK